jgi:hypothetical protein
MASQEKINKVEVIEGKLVGRKKDIEKIKAKRNKSYITDSYNTEGILRQKHNKTAGDRIVKQHSFHNIPDERWKKIFGKV